MGSGCAVALCYRVECGGVVRVCGVRRRGVCGVWCAPSAGWWCVCTCVVWCVRVGMVGSTCVVAECYH